MGAVGAPGKRTLVEARYGTRRTAGRGAAGGDASAPVDAAAGPVDAAAGPVDAASVDAAAGPVDAALAARGDGAPHASGAVLHTDERADSAAQAVGALAFSAGDDVFFAAGAYQPDDPLGAEVLAHELTHVEQARGVEAPAPGAYTVADRDDDAEAVARGETEDAATAQPQTIYRTTINDYSVDERRRVHFSDQAGGMQPPAHGTTASTTFRPSQIVLLGAGIPASLQTLFEHAVGRYEFGHVMAADTAIDRAVDIPAAEALLLAPTATPSSTGVTTPAATRPTTPAATPAPTTPGATPAPTTPGATPATPAPAVTDVSLIFRFTSIEHAAPSPPRRRPRRPPPPPAAPVGRRVLVEYLGPDTALADRAAPLPAGVSPADGGPVTAGAVTATVTGPWTAPQLQMLQETIALLPPGLQSRVAALRFQIFDHGGSEGAAFVPAGGMINNRTISSTHDTIVIQTSAFASDTTDARVGTHRPSVMTLAHELGHLLDSIEHNRTRAIASHTIAGLTTPPLTAAQQRTQSDTAMNGVHSFSGRRERITGLTNGSLDTAFSEDTRTTAGNAFRTAAMQDGTQLGTTLTPRTADQRARDHDRGYTPDVDRTGGITSYGDESWEEYFAEAFALFVTDRATLRALRPSVYAFFLARTASIPAPAAATTPPTTPSTPTTPIIPPGLLEDGSGLDLGAP